MTEFDMKWQGLQAELRAERPRMGLVKRLRPDHLL